MPTRATAARMPAPRPRMRSRPDWKVVMGNFVVTMKLVQTARLACSRRHQAAASRQSVQAQPTRKACRAGFGGCGVAIAMCANPDFPTGLRYADFVHGLERTRQDDSSPDR